MAAKKQQGDEQYADLYFPERGVNDVDSLNFMSFGFTPAGTNVRLYEALTGRGRGGSRPGITKWIDEQHSGDNEIQHLTTFVTVEGSLLGWSFNGQDQSFPGVYGGIGFLEQIPFSDPTGFAGDGGGGYQPNENVDSRTLTMSADVEEWPAGSTTTKVYGTVQDRAGDYVSLENVTLSTLPVFSPPVGTDGDGSSEATQFDLDDPPVGVNGVAEFDVASAVPRTVDYGGYTDGLGWRRTAARRPVRIRFTPYKLTHVASSSAVAVSAPVTITATLLDHLGAAVPDKTVLLHTTGGTGDGTTAVTNGSGVATFSGLTSSIAQTVFYTMMETSEEVHSISEVEVNYGASQFRQSTMARAVRSAGQTTLTATFDQEVLPGSLLVIAVGVRFTNATDSSSPAITDSLGNTYTQADTVDRVFNLGAGNETLRGRLFYAISGSAGACTVTATIASPVQPVELALAPHEYVDIIAVSPLHSVVTASGTSATAATGSPTLNAVGDLIVGFALSRASAIDLTLVSSPDFTTREEDGGGGIISFDTADYVSAASATGCSWTVQSGSQPWVAIAASFKQA